MQKMEEWQLVPGLFLVCGWRLNSTLRRIFLSKTINTGPQKKVNIQNFHSINSIVAGILIKMEEPEASSQQLDTFEIWKIFFVSFA